MEIRKEEYVSRALKLFLEKGYEDTTIRDIAASCGISHSKLIYHFRNKAALGLRISEGYLSWLLSRIDSAEYRGVEDIHVSNRIMWWSLHYSVISFHRDFARFYLELNSGSANAFLEATHALEQRIFESRFGINMIYDSSALQIDDYLLNSLDIALYRLCFEDRMTPAGAACRLLTSGVMPAMKTEVTVKEIEDFMDKYRVDETAKGFDPMGLIQ